MTFDELGLDERILEAISYMGFETASPIQEQSIPSILQGRDLIACAQTGTGKTAAFMLPILHHLSKSDHKGTSTLVIVPTRELAVQIEQQVQGFAYFVPVSSIAIYGGGSGNEWEIQKKGLESHADIIIATPGKLLSHMNMANVRFQQLKYLILDEADRMLDMGFYDDIKRIIEALPKQRQTLMFSATMPPKMRELAKNHLDNPHEVSIAISKPNESVTQLAYLVNDDHKARLIQELIKDKPNYESIIVFSSTKKNIGTIVRQLKAFNHAVEGISSDLEQKEREEVLNRFKARQTRIIVATDVLARGIDIKDIDLVVNFNVPSDGEDYVHRIGRTGRAEASGVAITLISSDEMYKFAAIESMLHIEVTKLNIPEHVGISPEWNTRRSRFGAKSGRDRSSSNQRGSQRSGKGEKSHRPKSEKPKQTPTGEQVPSDPNKKKRRFFKKKKSNPGGGATPPSA
jgi:ATP-dependent RNA helicase RhlE